MDPQTVFCPNLDGPARGQIGKGNIGIHSRKDGRYICQACHTTFSASKGTPFYRLWTNKDVATLVLTLLACGCPLHAIAIAFGLDEPTVASWEARSDRQWPFLYLAAGAIGCRAHQR